MKVRELSAMLGKFQPDAKVYVLVDVLDQLMYSPPIVRGVEEDRSDEDPVGFVLIHIKDPKGVRLEHAVVCR